MNADKVLIEGVFARPRMFCADIATFRDVVIFAQGVCHGLKPPHGSGTLPGLSEYLAAMFGCSPNQSWPEILLSQFGHLPLHEACDKVPTVLRGWQPQIDP